MSSMTVQNFPGSQWKFVSDHLPVGVVCSGNGFNLELASWNILNTKWLNYIESQGLIGSKITELNVKKVGAPLTDRDQEVLDKICQIARTNHVVCLQEVHSDVIEQISAKADDLGIGILCSDGKYNDKGVILFNRRSLEILKYEVCHGIYSDDGDNFIQNTLFKGRETNNVYQVMNTHIPGGPQAVGKAQFAAYVAEKVDRRAKVIFLAGDMNQNEEVMTKTINEATKDTFTIVPLNYSTHINTDKKAVKFDHIFVSAGDTIHIKGKDSSEFSEDVKEMADFLKQPEFQ